MSGTACAGASQIPGCEGGLRGRASQDLALRRATGRHYYRRCGGLWRCLMRSAQMGKNARMKMETGVRPQAGGAGVHGRNSALDK